MKKKETTEPIPVPQELEELPLYRIDQRLCRTWPDVYPSWIKAYPHLNIMAEIQKAHSWEMANPARRKVIRTRFLNNWLQRAQDQPRLGKTIESGETGAKCRWCNQPLFGTGSYSQDMHLRCRYEWERERVNEVEQRSEENEEREGPGRWRKESDDPTPW